MKVNKHYYWVQIINPKGQDEYYWHECDRTWKKEPEIVWQSLCGELLPFQRRNGVKIKSLRAAKRLIKKWKKYIPDKYRFVVFNRYTCFPSIFI